MVRNSLPDLRQNTSGSCKRHFNLHQSWLWLLWKDRWCHLLDEAGGETPALGGQEEAKTAGLQNPAEAGLCYCCVQLNCMQLIAALKQAYQAYTLAASPATRKPVLRVPHGTNRRIETICKRLGALP